MKEAQKIYILRSEHGTFAFSDVIETKDFYLVASHNSDEFTIYNKKLYRCEVQEAVKALEYKEEK